MQSMREDLPQPEVDMATLQSRTRQQIDALSAQLMDASRQTGDLPVARRLQQAVALLDAAAEIVGMIEVADQRGATEAGAAA
jgi:hypothetical protein